MGNDKNESNDKKSKSFKKIKETIFLKRPIVEAVFKDEISENYQKVGKFAFTLITLVLITVILKNLEGIFKPLIVSMFFTLLMQPLAKLLNRKLKIPDLLSFLFVFIIYAAFIYFVAKLIQANVSSFSEKFGYYAGKINIFLKYWNDKLKIVPESFTLDKLVKMIPNKAYNTILSFTASTFYEVLTFWLFMLILTLFYILETKNLDTKLVKAVGINKALKIRAVYRNITTSIKKYLVTKALINLGAALISGILMIVFGLDYLVLWMFLIFLLLWIPYIGAFFSIFFPSIMAFLQFDATWQPVLFAILLSSILISFGSILEPKALSKRLNISPLLVLLGMTFWGWVWGIIGVILSVPIIVALKIVFDNFPGTRPIGTMMAEAIEQDEAKQLKNDFYKNLDTDER
jgi:predicted PurR-regulated permease PerM